MTFTVRPFVDATKIMAQANPETELHLGVAEHYASEEAVALAPLGEWSDDPPVPTISRQRLDDREADGYTRDPRALVEYANFGGAIGTWNANGEGRWVSSPGEWILVAVELVQEQAEGDSDDFEDSPGSWVSVLFALWRIAEGWACAVWRPADAEVLATIMGLDALPSEGWVATRVWYGE